MPTSEETLFAAAAGDIGAFRLLIEQRSLRTPCRGAEAGTGDVKQGRVRGSRMTPERSINCAASWWQPVGVLAAGLLAATVAGACGSSMPGGVPAATVTPPVTSTASTTESASPTEPPTATPVRTTPTASAAPTAPATASTAPSTPKPSASPTGSPSPDAKWGPLAVIEPEDGSDSARNEGTIRITESCVFLERNTRQLLLVWPADRTTWNAERRTVAFKNYESEGDPESGATVSVGNGTHVVVGGSGGTRDASGQTKEEWLASREWVARPAASCPLDEWWTVGGLTR
jgi:hypothetical protein